MIVRYIQLNTTRNKLIRQGVLFNGIDLTNKSRLIQITYHAQNLLTQAYTCGIVMLAPKV